uniref:Uncharacterized protein AlNc14C121G6670 n=1 Tax=Albugo laibachii Nc14 TaxID=890382 RepID=F0WJE2_9STRA|nr:conserved hypothetical protein [Albugo laibachii Nc14]|eukprot:CCA21390.1 conserved hypothetical protein [Albugo laibachii Nc14]
MADNDDSDYDKLRDPTYEELYTGPRREKLPLDIQNMEQEETACNFCGVSYFVFAEVHELQDKIKLYTKALRCLSENARSAHVENVHLRNKVELFKTDTLHQMIDLKTQFVAVGQEYERLSGRYEADQKRISVLLHATEHNSNEQSLMQKNWQETLLMKEKAFLEELTSSNHAFEIFRHKAHEQQKRASLEIERMLLNREDLTARVNELQSYRVYAEEKMASEREVKEQLIDKSLTENGAASKLKATVEELMQERTLLSGCHESYCRTVGELKNTINMQQEEMRTREILQCSQLEEEHTRYQNKLQATGIRYRQALSDVNQQENLLLQRFAVVEDSKKKLSETLQFLRSTHASDLQVVEDDHSHEINALKITHEHIVSGLLNVQDELKHELEEKIKAQTALSRKLVDHETQATEWIAQMTELSNEMHNIENTRAILEEEVELQKEQFEQKQQGLLERLARVEAEKEELVLSQQQLQMKIATLKYRSKDLRQQLRLSSEKMQEQEEKLMQLKLLSSQQTVQSIPSSNQREDHEPQVAKLNREIQDKETEIVVLQRTVYRECLERTSLLERMRAANILPEIPGSIPESIDFSSSSKDTLLKCNKEDSTIQQDVDELNSQAPKASLYEKLRQASLRKSKPRRS